MKGLTCLFIGIILMLIEIPVWVWTIDKNCKSLPYLAGIMIWISIAGAFIINGIKNIRLTFAKETDNYHR